MIVTRLRRTQGGWACHQTICMFPRVVWRGTIIGVDKFDPQHFEHRQQPEWVFLESLKVFVQASRRKLCDLRRPSRVCTRKITPPRTNRGTAVKYPPRLFTFPTNRPFYSQYLLQAHLKICLRKCAYVRTCEFCF